MRSNIVIRFTDYALPRTVPLHDARIQ